MHPTPVTPLLSSSPSPSRHSEALHAASLALVRDAARRPLPVRAPGSWNLDHCALFERRLPRPPGPVSRLALLELLAGLGVFQLRREAWVVRTSPEAFEELYPTPYALQVELFKAFAAWLVPPQLAAAWMYTLRLSPLTALKVIGDVQRRHHAPILECMGPLPTAALAQGSPHALTPLVMNALYRPLDALLETPRIELARWLPIWHHHVSAASEAITAEVMKQAPSHVSPLLPLQAATSEQLAALLTDELIPMWLIPCGLLLPDGQDAWRVDTQLAHRVLHALRIEPGSVR